MKDSPNRPAGADDIARAEDAITETNHPRHPMVERLQRSMADCTVLFFNYKQYHWRTAGPHFRDHHLLFDEFARETLTALDEIAERLRMIGQDPLPSLFDAAGLANVRPTAAATAHRDMAREADDNTILAIRFVRDTVREADEADDPGTVDMLSKIVRVFEKQEWYLRELLKP